MKGQNRRRQKNITELSFCFLATKNKVKEESTQDKFNCVVFEACERWVLSSDSESDFNTHLEQVKSEKSRKVRKPFLKKTRPKSS